MHSMTAYGEGEFKLGALELLCEIKSLNSRYLGINISLPDGFSRLEKDIYFLLKNRIHRGTVNFKITILNSNISEDILYDYEDVLQNLNTVKNFISLAKLQDASLSDILKIFNPFYSISKKINSKDTELFLKEIDMVLNSFIEFRMIEGEALKKDIIKRIKRLDNFIIELEKNRNFSETKIQENLKEKIKKLNISSEDDRLHQEIIFYLNKLDFSEELIRLENQIQMMKEAIELDNTGRKLDFIIQEMNREITTIASKAKLKEISKIIILFKTEIEKIREQVQNVE